MVEGITLNKNTHYVDSQSLKRFLGLNWAKHYCINAQFYCFIDDDFYVSVPNILRYLYDPLKYPKYEKDPIQHLQETNQTFSSHVLLENSELYAGRMFSDVPPYRDPRQRYYTSMKSYPFKTYPKLVINYNFTCSIVTQFPLIVNSTNEVIINFTDMLRQPSWSHVQPC